jgi:hypothetical protein
MPPISPRRFFGAISSANVLLDVYSPPMNTPPMNRNAISRISDAIPIVE